MTVRLIHLSDIHFGGEHPEAVAAAAARIAQESADLIVISGDVTRFAERHEFVAARRWIDALDGDKFIVPGNHDTPYFDIAQRVLHPWRRYNACFKTTRPPNVVRPGLFVTGFNSARGVQVRLDWSKGAVSRGQRHRVVDRLETAEPGALRVVVCHHPLAEIIGGPITARVRGGSRTAAALTQARTDIVLTGHIHVPFAMAYPCGDQKTYAVGAGTLSVRERGVPPSFNLIEADEATITVTALAWTGSGFEPHRTWALDRRAQA
ncbi:metallophosphoesterase [Caulobacter sp. 73W]|uniref:Metallophosphoesterase n=1 Tax=Caulobacter sp. 73W TaxID=3161137 RepID=A0AB39KPK5_9CAUL